MLKAKNLPSRGITSVWFPLPHFGNRLLVLKNSRKVDVARIKERNG